MMANPKSSVISFLVCSFLLIGLFDVAWAETPQKSARKGGACAHQEVRTVQGSKILFQEDSFDFGQIPYNRRVTHVFRFQNVGTAPLLLARHVKSKAIQGC